MLLSWSILSSARSLLALSQELKGGASLCLSSYATSQAPLPSHLPVPPSPPLLSYITPPHATASLPNLAYLLSLGTHLQRPLCSTSQLGMSRIGILNHRHTDILAFCCTLKGRSGPPDSQNDVLRCVPAPLVTSQGSLRRVQLICSGCRVLKVRATEAQ